VSKGLGRVERIIFAEVNQRDPRTGEKPTVLLNSWTLSMDHRLPGYESRLDWTPSRSRRKAVVRAMHSFVCKFPEYALVGGQGRGILYLYDASDPLSAFWARLSVARGFVSRSEAQQLMEVQR
jgi:hypothetical protein